MRYMLLCATVALLSACSGKAPPADAGKDGAASATTPATAAPAPATDPALLRAEGIGGIRFGMTLAQAEQAAGGKAALPEPFDPACSMVGFAALPKLRFMVENGIVTRADAGPGIGNVLGVAVGAPVEQVRAAHPEAEETPHKYDADGRYLSFPSTDGRAAIVLEASGGKVTKIRAGLQPAVAYVETCG